jgi:hypothetical protein
LYFTKKQIVPFHYTSCNTFNATILLDIQDGRIVGFGKQLGVNLGSHEESSSGGAANEKDPDRTPSIRLLEWSDRQEANRSRDGTTPVNESRDGTKGLVVSTD